MADVNYWAVLVAAVVTFIASGAWYTVFGNELARLHPAYAGAGGSPVWTVPAELVRSLVVAAVVSGLESAISTDGVADAVVLGAVIWFGFPAMILAGSVFHEKVPTELAAIHAGDWLVKLLAIAVIVGLWS